MNTTHLIQVVTIVIETVVLVWHTAVKHYMTRLVLT